MMIRLRLFKFKALGLSDHCFPLQAVLLIGFYVAGTIILLCFGGISQLSVASNIHSNSSSFELPASPLVEVGKDLLEAGDLGAAFTVLDKAIELNATDPVPHFVKARALNQLGNYTQAIESYDRAIALYPEYKNAYFNKGLILYETGGIREANYLDSVRMFDKVIELDPADKDAYIAKINSLVELGDIAHERPNEVNNSGYYARAMKTSDKGLELDPKDLLGLYSKGLVFSKLNNDTEAIRSFSTVLTIDPTYELALMGIQQCLEAFNRTVIISCPESVPGHDPSMFP